MLTGPRLWGAVAGLSIDQLVAWGVLYYAYVVLSGPIAQDLGVPQVQVAAAFSVCLLSAGWAGGRVGVLVDARGTRGALRTGAVVAPLVFAALRWVDGLASLLIGFALLGVAQALTLYEPAFRTLVDWCPHEPTRQRAMLFVTSVGGLASAVFLPLTGWLLDRYGWRLAVLVLAGGFALLLVPLRFLLPLPNRPRPGAIEAPFRVPASARRLALGLSMHALATTGVFVYLMWHLIERGEASSGAAGIAGLAGAAQIPGRIVSGPLRRMIGAGSFLPVLLGVQAAALLGVVLASSALGLLCILLFGAASGMMTLERATLLVEWYGPRRFGSHQGHLATATGTARAVSPFVVESGHCVASYGAVFGVLGLVLTAAAFACLSAATLRTLERSRDPAPRPIDP